VPKTTKKKERADFIFASLVLRHPFKTPALSGFWTGGNLTQFQNTVS